MAAKSCFRRTSRPVPLQRPVRPKRPFGRGLTACAVTPQFPCLPAAFEAANLHFHGDGVTRSLHLLSHLFGGPQRPIRPKRPFGRGLTACAVTPQFPGLPTAFEAAKLHFRGGGVPKSLHLLSHLFGGDICSLLFRDEVLAFYNFNSGTSLSALIYASGLASRLDRISG